MVFPTRIPLSVLAHHGAAGGVLLLRGGAGGTRNPRANREQLSISVKP